jgi:thiol-disulfide isomerase/thioredoxin
VVWAPWCPTCVAEAPNTLAVDREHADEVTVLGVASLGEVDLMREFVSR